MWTGRAGTAGMDNVDKNTIHQQFGKGAQRINKVKKRDLRDQQCEQEHR